MRFQSSQTGSDDKLKKSFRGQLYDSTAKRVQAERILQARGRSGREGGGDEAPLRGGRVFSRIFCESLHATATGLN